MKKLTATKARNDFFNLLDSVYLDDNMYQIEKSGIPVAILIKPEHLKQNKHQGIMKFAGAWQNAPKTAPQMIKKIKRNRKRNANRYAHTWSENE